MKNQNINTELATQATQADFALISSAADIKDPIVRNATKGMQRAMAGGKKASWELAFHATVIKEAFQPANKEVQMSTKLKEQFGSLKGYCEAIGINPATIHNSAKAFAFMSEQHLLPMKVEKSGKHTVDFSKIELSVAQAVELGAFSPEQLTKFKQEMEQTGIDYKGLSSASIRSWLRDEKGLTEGKPNKALTAKDKAKKEETKEVKEGKESRKATRPEAIQYIVGLMKEYSIDLEELKAELEGQA